MFGSRHSDDSEWLTISDLMSGLMLVFLALAIFYMVNISKIATFYEGTQGGIYWDLCEEICHKLPAWGAELDSTTLTVRFSEPDVLFENGEAVLKPRFEEILSDFFPSYIKVLMRAEYRDHIEEVRIEGHTSSYWENLSPLEAYEQNMRLSQERTRAVLGYVVRLEGVSSVWEDWLRERLTANGLSSSKPIKENGIERTARSRRVEFRVRTDAEEQMRRIRTGTQ